MLEPGHYKILLGSEESLIGKMTTLDEDTHVQFNTVELEGDHTWPIGLEVGEVLIFERLASELDQSFEHEAESREVWSPWNELIPKEIDGGGVEISRALEEEIFGFGLFGADLEPQINHFGLIEAYPIEVPIGRRVYLNKISSQWTTEDLVEACNAKFNEEWSGTQVRETYST